MATPHATSSTQQPKTSRHGATPPTQPDLPETLVGMTLEWTFDDGPTAGTTFEHTFNEDGSVDFIMTGEGAESAETTHCDECAAIRIAPGIFAISYLGESGYTLTCVLDFASQRVTGFASNGEEWYCQEGSFNVMGGETGSRRSRGNRPASRASNEEE